MQDFQEILNQRKQLGTLRSLKAKQLGIDFFSNDYLGLSRNKTYRNELLKTITANPFIIMGSSGSRLISGNSQCAMDVEQYIAEIHQFPASLVFSSGYNANLAIFSTLPNRHETIIVDELIHRSVHDGCKMSLAKKIKFKHNDLEDLERILKNEKKHCYVAVESLYSMEGDFAPLEEIVLLTEKYNASLIVDEAHAFGVFGLGMVDKFHLQNKVFAAVVTYGKALGAHGASILCDDLIKNYLVNFASTFIYTTAAPDLQWIAIKLGYEFLLKKPNLEIELQKNIKDFNRLGFQSPSSSISPIQAILISDSKKLKFIQNALFKENYLTSAIYSPTVKLGSERLRICIHHFNTKKEILKLAYLIKENLN